MEKEQNKIQVALVDDEPRIHDMICDVLKHEQVADRFNNFYEPLEFLEFLKQASKDDIPDIVLLDVNFENSGLTGIDIIPFIREDYPFLPIVLLTGMEGEEIEGAQEFECTYFIPKPVSSEHLVRMIRFYLGKGKKSADRIQEMSQDLDEHRQLLDILENELKEASLEAVDKKPYPSQKEVKAFERIEEIMLQVLKNTKVMPSFLSDLKKLYNSDFKLLKKTIDATVQLDLSDISMPGSNIHKYYGADNVYSVRLSKKARFFYYQPQPPQKRKLLRLDPEHDTKSMDKWLKSNHRTYTSDP